MRTLTDRLARESDLVRQFIASLNAEQEALKRGEVDSLAAINSQKAELVEQLNAAENERNAALVQAGHSGDREGMEAWLAKNRVDRAAAIEWSRLIKLATEARELNNLNGKLIALRLQATSQAIAALTNQSQRASLYGPTGRTTARTGSRIIDAA